MKIVLKSPASAGDTELPAGEYWVSLSGEGRFINLTGGGKDYKIPAIKRNSKTKVRIFDVQFYASSSSSWTLIVKSPPTFEFMGTLHLGRKAKEKK